MNRQCLKVLLCVGLLGASWCRAAEPVQKAERKAKPELKVDASPVALGAKAGVVVSYADVLEPTQKSVVSIHSLKSVKSRATANPVFRQFFGEMPEGESKAQGLGSGVIVSPDGFIVTNHHVVDDADELKVYLSDEREFTAKVIGADPKTDVAVIKIEAENLQAVTVADSEKLRVGDVVFALGNPLGVGQTVTMGIVSAVGRSNLELLEGGEGYESFIQTDAAINMGNSGGALVDARGRLIGINTAIMSPSKGSVGIGFAIPVNLVVSTLNSLVENDGVVRRGMLGVKGLTLSEEPGLAEALGLKKDQRGVVVQKLNPEDGPAAKAGMKREDVIVAINERPVHSLQDLRFVVSQMAPGSVVRVRLLRDGKELTLPVTVGLLDAEKVSDELVEGLRVTPLTPALRKQYDLERELNGLLITEVSERSKLKDKLNTGYVIIEVNRTPVSTVREAKEAMVRGRNNLLYVYIQGSYRYIALPSK